MVNIVLPMCLVVGATSLTLWLPASSDRIGYAATLLLTVYATMIFTAEMRPASNDETWLDIFQGMCLFRTFMPLFFLCIMDWMLSKVRAAHEEEKSLAECSGQNVSTHSVRRTKWVVGIDGYSRVLVHRMLWAGFAPHALEKMAKWITTGFWLSFVMFLWPRLHAEGASACYTLGSVLLILAFEVLWTLALSHG